MDNSNVGAAPRLFLRIFSEATHIRTVGSSTLLKIYTLPNHTITIGVCMLETQLLGLLYGGGTSFVQKWSMPWMSANIQVPFLYSLISMVSNLQDQVKYLGLNNILYSKMYCFAFLFLV
jgi:hypothetical protein